MKLLSFMLLLLLSSLTSALAFSNSSKEWVVIGSYENSAPNFFLENQSQKIKIPLDSDGGSDPVFSHVDNRFEKSGILLLVYESGETSCLKMKRAVVFSMKEKKTLGNEYFEYVVFDKSIEDCQQVENFQPKWSLKNDTIEIDLGEMNLTNPIVKIKLSK